MLHNPEVGPISLPWGEPPSKKPERRGFGLSKIMVKHPEAMHDLPGLVASAKVTEETQAQIVMRTGPHVIVANKQHFDDRVTYLVTAYEKVR